MKRLILASTVIFFAFGAFAGSTYLFPQANSAQAATVVLQDGATSEPMLPNGSGAGRPNSRTCSDASTKFVGDGVTDNAAAFANWFSGLGGKSGCLMFPAGTFRFNSLSDFTLADGQSLTLQGAGPATELFSSGAHDLLHVQYAAKHKGVNSLAGALTISGFRITTDQRGTTKAIYVNGGSTPGNVVTPTLFSNLMMEGRSEKSGFGTHIHLKNTATVNIDHLKITGLCIGFTCTDIGVFYEGDEGRHPTGLLIYDMFMIRGGTGVYATGDIEGIWVNSSKLVAQVYGVKCIGTGNSGHGVCSVSDSHINPIAGAIVVANMNDITIANNKIYGGAYGGMPKKQPLISINRCVNTAITGNILQGFNGNKFYPSGMTVSKSHHGIVTGNIFNRLAKSVDLDDSSQAWVLGGNVLANVHDNSD